MKVVTIRSTRERSLLSTASQLPSFQARQIEDHAADAHLCALGSKAEIRAHCSVWWREAPPMAGHRIGAIGHYASMADDASAALLEEAVRQLRENGCTLAVAPMDGNTWRRYRFVTDFSAQEHAEPPFFLEPANPPEWPTQFEQAGFTSLAEYYSALNSHLDRPDDRVAPIAARVQANGISIRAARRSELPLELKRIYALTCVAFTRNFLYTELPEAAFLAQYVPVLQHIRPELILLAEQGSALVGYLFAIPDFAQAARVSTIDTFVIKTVAILPESRLRGLGGLLVSRAHLAGRELGFKRAIHALMHEDNVSRHISNRYATTMRRYTLYSRELAQ